MSKYNKYAKDLEEAFKKARAEYKKLVEVYNETAAQYEEIKNGFIEEHQGQKENMLAIYSAMVKEAKDKIENRGREIWKEFEIKRAEIGTELAKAVKLGNMAKPEDIDNDGLELMKGGVLDADEAAEMANKYADNPTMLRFVAKYADQKRNDTKIDKKERGKFIAIADRIGNGTTAVMTNWQELVIATNRLSGAGGTGMKRRDPQFSVAMAEKWEELAAPVIEDF